MTDPRFQALREDYAVAFVCPRKLSLILQGAKADRETGRTGHDASASSASANVLGRAGEEAVHRVFAGGLPMPSLGIIVDDPFGDMRDTADATVFPPMQEQFSCSNQDASVKADEVDAGQEAGSEVQSAQFLPEKVRTRSIPVDLMLDRKEGDEKPATKLVSAPYADLGVQFATYVTEHSLELAQEADRLLPVIPSIQDIPPSRAAPPLYLEKLNDAYGFQQVYRQVRVDSDTFLVSGLCDYVAIDRTGSPVVIEAKNTRTKSWRDRFQVALYLNMLRQNGRVYYVGGAVDEDNIKHLLLRQQLWKLEIFRRVCRKAVGTVLCAALESLLRTKGILQPDKGLSDIGWTSARWEELMGISPSVFLRSVLKNVNKYTEAGSLYATAYDASKSTSTTKRGPRDRETLDKASLGLLLYHRFNEILEVRHDEFDLPTVVRDRWDAVARSLNGEALVVPEDAACGRCRYKTACAKSGIGKTTDSLIAPLPYLYELLDQSYPTSEMLGNAERREIVSRVGDTALQEKILAEIAGGAKAMDLYGLAHIYTEIPVVGFDWSLGMDMRGARYVPADTEKSLAVKQVAVDILGRKVRRSVHDEDRIGRRLLVWGEKNIVSSASDYIERRITRRAPLSEEVMSFWDL